MGTVFDIQRFSLHDGPGIRTTFFLMGCPLRCRWCHNPEGILGKIQLQYNEKDCIQCGACVQACPNNVHHIENNKHTVKFDQCDLCGKCIAICPSKALQKSGEVYTPKELAEKGNRDLLFYKNNGGVTFSGGEPLLQSQFVAETAKLCKTHGVPTVAVDTSGDVEWSAFECVLPWVDYFLFDIKAATEKNHLLGTGCSNQRILENLFKLDRIGKKIFIRIPLIPTVNASKEEFNEIAKILDKLHNVEEVRIIPYHTFGREKYTTLGYFEPDEFTAPSDQEVEEFQAILGI